MPRKTGTSGKALEDAPAPGRRMSSQWLLTVVGTAVRLPCQLTLSRFEEMRTAARSFAALGAYGANAENVTLSGNGEPEALKGARVSANFLDVLGVQPALGRGFLRDEDTSGGPPVAMIGAELWKRRFSGDPLVAGKTATLDSIPYTIVGVLPRVGMVSASAPIRSNL